MAKTIKTSKTSKQNISQLQNILSDLIRSRDFIMDNKTFVCRQSSGTTVLDFQNKKTGSFIYPINKEYGSNLCGIESAIDGLRRFIQFAK